MTSAVSIQTSDLFRYLITVFQLESTQKFLAINVSLVNSCVYFFLFLLHGFKVEIKTAKTTVSA